MTSFELFKARYKVCYIQSNQEYIVIPTSLIGPHLLSKYMFQGKFIYSESDLIVEGFSYSKDGYYSKQILITDDFGSNHLFQMQTVVVRSDSLLYEFYKDLYDIEGNARVFNEHNLSYWDLTGFNYEYSRSEYDYDYCIVIKRKGRYCFCTYLMSSSLMMCIS